MLSISDLPLLNATLNGLSALLLAAGYISIRRGSWEIHKRFMLSALLSSTLFLISYLVYHYHIGSKPFQGIGLVRTIYFVILSTHVVLAFLIVPLALITVTRGLKSQFDRHVKIARWTFPLWMYVSITGVIIYLMLYRMY